MPCQFYGLLDAAVAQILGLPDWIIRSEEHCFSACGQTVERFDSGKHFVDDVSVVQQW